MARPRIPLDHNDAATLAAIAVPATLALIVAVLAGVDPIPTGPTLLSAAIQPAELALTAPAPTPDRSPVLQQVLAQGGDVTGGLLQYGALGILALLAVAAVRVLFARISASADAERARADRHEEELRRLNAAIQERYLVTLAEATRVIGEVLVQLREDRR